MDSTVNDSLKYPNKSVNKIAESTFVREGIQSGRGLHLLSAAMQILLGLCVVALSLIGNIQPLWLATMMTVAGSVTAVFGFYLFFESITGVGVFDSLLHKAIKRAVKFQN